MTVRVNANVKNGKALRLLHDPDIKMILVVFLPIFVDMILNNLIATVHSYFVAGVGEAAISGIGLVGTVNSILIVFFMALPSAVAVLVSQYRGAGDAAGARKCSSQAMTLVALLSLPVAAVMIACPDVLFRLFFSDSAAPDVLKEGIRYMICTGISIPFYGVFQTGACISRGYNNHKIPLFVSVSGSVVNVVLSFILIKLSGLGVLGAGIGLIVSRAYTAFVVCVPLAKNGWFARRDEYLRIDWHCLGAIFKLGILTSSETLIVNFGGTLKTRFIVEAGTAHIAASSINSTLFNLCAVPLSAFGTVAITLIGRYIGSEEKDEAKTILKKLLYLSIAVYVFALAVAFFLFPLLFPLYTDNPETLRLLRIMLYINVLMLPVSNPFTTVVANAFKGAGDATFCTLVSIACMWLVNVGLGIVLASGAGLGLGVIGSLISGHASLIAKTVFYFARLRSGKWIRKRLI